MNGKTFIEIENPWNVPPSSTIGRHTFNIGQKISLILTTLCGILNPVFAEEGNGKKDEYTEIRLQQSTTLGKGGPIHSTSAMVLFPNMIGIGQNTGGLVGYQWGPKWETIQTILGMQPTKGFASIIGASKTQGYEKQLVKIEPSETRSHGEEGRNSSEPVYLIKNTPYQKPNFSVGGIIFPDGLGPIEDIKFGAFGGLERGTPIDSLETLISPRLQTLRRNIGVYTSTLLNMEKLGAHGFYVEPGIKWELTKEWAVGEEPGKKWSTFTPSVGVYYITPELPNTLFTGKVRFKIPANIGKTQLGFEGGIYNTVGDTGIVTGIKAWCTQGEETRRFSCQATLGVNIPLSGGNSVFAPTGEGLQLFHLIENSGLGE